MANYGTNVEQRLTPSSERALVLAEQIAQSFRVALPAIVQEFFPGPPATVSVIIATNEYVEQNFGADKIDLKTKAMQLPLLQDVPVAFASAGGWSLTFPIKKGDECLVIFADTALDVWWQNGGLDNHPIAQRRHNLSDGVAWFGLRSTPKGLAGYATGSMQLRNDAGDVVIDLAPSKITITAPTVDVQCTGTASVEAATATVQASTIQITGSEVTIGTATKVDNKQFLTHTHSGVQAGLSTTGPVA